MSRSRSHNEAKALYQEVHEMLRALPKSWFSYSFDVFDRSGMKVATADMSNWRENAKLEVGSRRYLARHETWAREFVLEGEDGLIVAMAEKPSAWRDVFSLDYGDVRYELRKESPWRSSFVLSREGASVVGSIRQKSFFGRETSVELPHELPVEVRVFILWLATLMRKRAESAAAGASGTGS